jgi:hypothetical protein
VFSNPITETTANRDGIIQVIRKMKWYSALLKLLLEESSTQDKHFTEIRSELADEMLNLYKAILKYVVKSICAYYRNQAFEALRKLAKADDWNESLGDVISAENSVRAMSGDYGTRQANMYLGGIFNLQLSAAQNEIMQKLCVTDMRAEMDSLERRKDHLLANSYNWILETQQYENFVDWHHSNRKRLLWIRGGPGKGKTMLLVGIIRELMAQQDTHFDTPRLSYFFCQDADTRLSTATSVLRGLIWMLLQQERSLLCHLDTLFGNLGSKLFEDPNAFDNLKAVLQNMLEDKALKRAYLVVDALDECKDAESGRCELLALISKISETNCKVKWLVSSRDVPDIARSLKENNVRTALSLEAPSIADSLKVAVNAYIKFKMSGLAERFIDDLEEECDTGENLVKVQGIRDAVEEAAEALRLRADGTFLWIALVCKQIEETKCGPDKVLGLVHDTPRDLSGIYDKMIRQVVLKTNLYSNECTRVLLITARAYTPLRLSELVTLAGFNKLTPHRNIVKSCGLLTLREDDVVYFVHQSANEHLNKDLESGLLSKASPLGHAEGHRTIVLQSLHAMEEVLERDIYGLRDPGCMVSSVKPPVSDPLAPIRYSCLYWVDHLCEMETSLEEVGLRNNGRVDLFLQVHLLHWLEALSIFKNISSAIAAMKKLGNLVSVSSCSLASDRNFSIG